MQNTPNFKGLGNNKLVLKGLEKIAEHGTTFVAATSLAMAVGVRPVAIALTPGVDKENKQYSCTNSIASGLIKFAMVEAIALPIENAVKKIDKNPQQYLKPETINKLKGTAANLTEAKGYNLAGQIIKLGSGIITTLPKATLTIALIPVIMDILFKKKEKNKQETKQYFDSFISASDSETFSDIQKQQKVLSPSFKGAITQTTAKGIGKILDNKAFQNFVTNPKINSDNVARNMSMATDILLTTSFVYRTSKSKKIKEERKKPLIYNNIISTGISLFGGYTIDKAIQKSCANSVKKFAQQHKNDPKLAKYIDGINILRPTLVFAGVYYGLLPIFTTYLADKIDKIANKNTQKTDKI